MLTHAGRFEADKHPIVQVVVSAWRLKLFDTVWSGPLMHAPPPGGNVVVVVVSPTVVVVLFPVVVVVTDDVPAHSLNAGMQCWLRHATHAGELWFTAHWPAQFWMPHSEDSP